jgi:bifunctional ADP-heptose synthase (sugar kinase/adenylyltransferase)
VPAYWTQFPPPTDPDSTATTTKPDQPSRHPSVVDTTGAGNCFLGGYAIALVATGDHVKAARYGAVASSFVVQQLGLPTLTPQLTNDQGAWKGDATELWNWESASMRLEAYLMQDGVCDVEW